VPDGRGDVDQHEKLTKPGRRRDRGGYRAVLGGGAAYAFVLATGSGESTAEVDEYTVD
jgi:hypothetical protein